MQITPEIAESGKRYSITQVADGTVNVSCRRRVLVHMQDFRSALRLFVRAPLATAVVVVSLGLGIGANTAVFSFVDAVQFKALPFVDESP